MVQPHIFFLTARVKRSIAASRKSMKDKTSYPVFEAMSIEYAIETIAPAHSSVLLMLIFILFLVASKLFMF